MRLPFISRRRAQAAVDLAVAGVWHLVDEAEKATVEARADQRTAEGNAAADREKYRRAVAYVEQAEDGRYENGVRLTRALRAVARYRAEAAVQRRTIAHLTDQLLDATGYQGEPLLPAARTALGIDPRKEDQ
ncbi:hypothetical protein ACN9M0_24935 [Streptomyces sp. R-07]|uniref:hypothetical protein n=1 Tax=Streptomyces sp. R-07 TaxID=3404052 RepID=UPI003CE97782